MSSSDQNNQNCHHHYQHHDHHHHHHHHHQVLNQLDHNSSCVRLHLRKKPISEIFSCAGFFSENMLSKKYFRSAAECFWMPGILLKYCSFECYDCVHVPFRITMGQLRRALQALVPFAKNLFFPPNQTTRVLLRERKQLKTSSALSLPSRWGFVWATSLETTSSRLGATGAIKTWNITRHCMP